ncbi:DNA mismatch repair MSH4 [Tubulinosema ratisbonensis]|uniref:DNA mismatch repair MSH4 n=1 Tax=Tubulinosema ratisbonensis TaxID=291195 RepID=A0A437AI84_9MICR|nr:DNA mismatch repair MSH4 [Tubulinosema ratisbonensis]
MKENRKIASISISRSNNPLVAITLFDTETKIVECYEFIDDHFLTDLFTNIKCLNIQKILVLKGLKEIIQNEIKCEIIEVKRNEFNVEYSQNKIRELKGNSNILEKEINYFLLGALSVLFKEIKEKIIDIKLCKLNDRMCISERTAYALNLVGNDSVYQKIKFTKTKMGADCLLKNILEPLTNIEEIKIRQNFVKHLIDNENTALNLEEILESIPNIESIVNKCNNLIDLESESTINLFLDVFNLICNLINLENFFEKNSFMNNFIFVKKIKKEISELKLEEIKIKFKKFLNVEYKKNGNTFLRTDFINFFEIKNELLEILEKVYFENLDDLNQIIKECFSEEVILVYDKKRGFHLKTNDEKLINSFIKNMNDNSVTNNTILLTESSKFFEKESEQTKENILNNFDLLYFIKKNKTIYFSIMAVEQINKRITDVLEKIILILGKELKEVIKEISDIILCFSNFINGLGMIDMLFSFYVFYLKNDGSFPEFEDTLVFNESMNILLKKGNIKKNNVFSSKVLNFAVITGENCGGKTCYLKMIGINVILSQIGCVVPCKYAKSRIFKKILCKTSDYNDLTLSSFGNELLDTKIILEQCNKDTLILIDELGCNTNLLDGFSLLLTLCRILLEKDCFVFLTTHFKEILFHLSENKKINFLKMNNFVITNGILEESNVIQLAKEYLPNEYCNDFINFKKYFKETNQLKLQKNSFNFLANKILTCNEEKKEELRKKLKDFLE